MGSVRKVCPRGHQALVPLSGGGCFCLLCSYEEVDDPLSVYSEVMAAVPGAPLPNTRLGRYEEEVSRVGGDHQRVTTLRLAEEAAQRHGVSLEDLRIDMRPSKSIPSHIRWALQAVIADLAMSGLGDRRIANVLHKARGTIRKSSGLARGRAARKRSPVALAAHGGLPLVTASSVEQLRERVKGAR